MEESTWEEEMTIERSFIQQKRFKDPMADRDKARPIQI